MKYGKILSLMVGMMVLLAAACSPPGANPGDESGAANDGEGAQQQVAENTGEQGDAPVCDVEPPDINLDEAVVGFSQSETLNNPFRITETESVEGEAEERGVELISTNAQSGAPKQLSDIQDMLAQGAEVLIIAPLLEEGLEPALNAASQQGVPVFLIDRETAGEPCEDYITFMGSDFLQQGEQAAEKLVEITDGEAQIVELGGVPGASVTNDRAEGFRNIVEEEQSMEIIASQTANFVRAEGQTVMEQLIQSNPDLDAVYAHNDEMAIGAIQALRDAGRNPGEDVKIISIDGTRDAAQAIVNGELNAMVTTNPRFGPLAFDTIEDFLAGEPIPQKIIVQDEVIDEGNAEEYLDSGAY